MSNPIKYFKKIFYKGQLKYNILKLIKKQIKEKNFNK